MGFGTAHENIGFNEYKLGASKFRVERRDKSRTSGELCRDTNWFKILTVQNFQRIVL